MSRQNSYVFTINNYTPETLKTIQDYLDTNSCCRYLSYGEEVGASGTPHIQGYIEFFDGKGKTASAFNKSCNLKKGGNWANCLRRLGTPEEASGYTKKGSASKPDEGYSIFHSNPDKSWTGHSYGELSKQGERTDLKEIVDQIMAGTLKVNTIKRENPMLYHKYGRTLNDCEDLYLRSQFRTEMTEGVWLFGPTGVGKSHLAFQDYDPDNVYEWKKDDKGWQDGYTGQEVVVINEFRGDTMKYDHLLELVDKWPKTVSRRGREPVPFLAKLVIITSSLSPEEVFCNRAKKDNIAQLYRRFTVKQLAAPPAQTIDSPPKRSARASKLLESSGGVIIRPPVCDAPVCNFSENDDQETDTCVEGSKWLNDTSPSTQLLQEGARHDSVSHGPVGQAYAPSGYVSNVRERQPLVSRGGLPPVAN